MKKHVLFLLVLFLAATAAFGFELVRVVDGDTFVAAEDGGDEVRFRLWGVDAPELDQPFGVEARERAEDLLSDGFTINPVNIDRYGRVVAIVVLPSGDELQTMLLLSGHAWHSTFYAPHGTAYSHAQSYAESRGAGLWSDPTPVPPWDWR
jgi:endonuclease YncB( thermonuclease family)